MISAGWTTNGAGDRYSLIDQCSPSTMANKKTDIFGMPTGEFERCLIRDLLSNHNYDMLIRHILDDGAKYEDKCKFSLKRGIRCIFVGKSEYRATSTEFYKRSCNNWR